MLIYVELSDHGANGANIVYGKLRFYDIYIYDRFVSPILTSMICIGKLFRHGLSAIHYCRKYHHIDFDKRYV